LLCLAVACAPSDNQIHGVDTERPKGPQPEPEPTLPPERTQDFTYTKPQLDLVYLIDAPIFVGELLNTVDVFLAALRSRDIDYHLGVANIDFHANDSGMLEEHDGIRWVDDDHPDPANWIRAAIQQVWSRSPDECATLTAYEVLRRSAPGGINAGFYRDGSEIAFLLFSDNFDISDQHGVSQDDFLELLFSVEPDTDNLGFHMIRFHWGDPWGNQHNFDKIREHVPGLEWDAQVVPYFPLLVSITQTVERHNIFQLDAVPMKGTLRAEVVQPGGDRVELPGSHLVHDLETNTVDLGTFFPDHGATVRISYIPEKG